MSQRLKITDSLREKPLPGLTSKSLQFLPETTQDEQSIAQRFEAMVEAYPDRPAIRTLEGCISYRELNHRANRIAHALAGACASMDRPVATLLSMSPEYICTLFGALKAGRFYVSLAPDFPAESSRKVLAVAAPDVLITDTESLYLAEELAGDGCTILNIDALGDSLEDTNPGLEITPDALAYMVFTSGSTGVPKGVFQNQRNLLRYCRSQVEVMHLTATDCINCCSTPPVFGTITSIFAALMAGAAVFPVNVTKHGFPGLRDSLEQGHVTIFTPYVTLFRRFARTLSGNENFSAIRLVRPVGEATTSLDFQRFRALFSSSCRLLISYGSSEAMGVCARFYDRDAQIKEGNLSPGVPVAGVEVKIIDAQGRPCATGESGEIVISSPFVSLGYWKREDLSREVFSGGSDASSNRSFRTGDLGCLLADGSLVHQGRRDFQLKIRGFRVELPAVELALARIEGIEEVSVVGIDNAMNEKELLAFYVPANKQPLPKLRTLLGESLPDHMVPQRIVALGSLPRTDTDKVNTALLSDRAFLQSTLLQELRLDDPEAEPARPTGDPGDNGAAQVTVMDSREQALADIWTQVLKVARPSPDSRFFQVGGSSLDAMEMQSQIEQVFGVPVSLDSIFDDPTLADLAAQLPHPKPATGALAEVPTAILRNVAPKPRSSWWRRR